jgi:hypothetical protein
MRLQRRPLIRFFTFTLAITIFICGFQPIKIETISGVIEGLDKNSKSIVVNNTQILISSQTKVVDGNGHILKIEDLNPNLPVSIQGIRNSNGFTAIKIVVKTLKKNP